MPRSKSKPCPRGRQPGLRHGLLERCPGWGGWYWNMLQPMYLNANQSQCQLLNPSGDRHRLRPTRLPDAAVLRVQCQRPGVCAPDHGEELLQPFHRYVPQYGYSWEPNPCEAAGEPMVIGEDVGVARSLSRTKAILPTPLMAVALMILTTTPERQNRAWISLSS